MGRHKSSRRFLVVFLIIHISLLLCSTTAMTTKFGIGLSISIPFFLSVSYSNGSYSETITTQDQVVNRLVPLEYLPRSDGQYESVIALEIRSNADWDLTITPVNIDESSYWTFCENVNDQQHQAIDSGNPISELGATFQCSPESPVSWHLHVLSPAPVEKELVPAKKVFGAPPSSAASMPSIQLSVVQHGS